MEQYKKMSVFIGIVCAVLFAWLLVRAFQELPDAAPAEKTSRSAALKRALSPEQKKLIDSDIAFSLGPKDAAVTMVTFLDFQCDFCRLMAPIIRRLTSMYHDASVRFVFRHYPLVGDHPIAFEASRASLCAREQGKFMEMHDAIFEKQRQLSVSLLSVIAKNIGLADGAFLACMAQKKYENIIMKDILDAQDIGVTGTPSFFINGNLLVGTASIDIFQKEIDAALSRAR